MATAEIGALRVLLSMDAGEFTTGANRAKQQAASLESALLGVAKRITLAFAALDFTQMIAKMFGDLNQLNKLADTTGISVEALSKLKFAANDVGLGFDGLSGAIEHFNTQLVDISRDPTVKAGQALSQIGVGIKDAGGVLKNFDVLLPEIADKFAGFANGANKSALATAIFGKAGADLIPLLNEGSTGISRLGDEARKAGVVLDTGVAQQMREAEKASIALKAAWDGLVQQLTVSLAPTLKVVANVVSFIASGFNSLNQLSTDDLNKQIGATTAEIARLEAKVEDFKTSTAGNMLSDVFQPAPFMTDLDAARKKLEELKTALADRNALQVDIRLPAPNLEALVKMKEDLDAFIEKLHGLPVLFTEGFAFDAKPFEEAMARVNAAMQANAIGTAAGAKMKLGLQKDEQGQILNTASLAASTLTTVFNKNKLASVAAAIINTAVGVTKALSDSPPPFNFINASLVAAAGAVQLASIRSTSQSGGGAVTSPTSGASNADQQPTAPAAAPQSSTLFVRGLTAGQFLSGEVVRDLAQKLVDFQRDGGKVVLT